MLLNLRSDTNIWGIPGCSKELNETLEEYAIRELKEETNINVKDLELITVFSGKEYYFSYPNEEEFSQICGFNLKPQKNKIRSLPYAFTEQGVAMLATVIRTGVAAKVSIDIMRAFVRMRHYIRYNDQLLPRKYLLLEEKVENNTKRIDELFDKFNPKIITKNSIFFKGDIYDAYSVLLEIFNLAKEEIIIIDNYVNKELLDILKNIDRIIIIISSNINDTLKSKYLKQYNNVEFINNNSYHDRFIIIEK